VFNDLPTVQQAPAFPLTVKKAGNKLRHMRAKQKRVTAPANYHKEVRRVSATEGQTPAPVRSPGESRKLLVRAFSHPEGSSERRQAFSKYLDALHDEHAK
jgi:hypothetical protein